MRKFWLKYGLYGCILGLMWRKIWTRAHEESKISLRPTFQPDSSCRTLSPVDSYQNIPPVDYKPIAYTYATRQLIQDQADAKRALADYRLANGPAMPLQCTTRDLALESSITMQTIFL